MDNKMKHIYATFLLEVVAMENNIVLDQKESDATAVTGNYDINKQ